MKYNKNRKFRVKHIKDMYYPQYKDDILWTGFWLGKQHAQYATEKLANEFLEELKIELNKKKLKEEWIDLISC